MADVFALRDAGLNPFLFSDVGTESNGTGLTILSLLARLGKDPWDEAAAWSRKPKEAAIASLTDSILKMPPNQQAFTDAHQTASRLVALLPVPAAPSAAAIPSVLKALPKRMWLPLLYLALFAVLKFWLAPAPQPDAAPQPAPHADIASTK